MIKNIFVFMNFLGSFVVLAVLVMTRGPQHPAKLVPVRVRTDEYQK